MQRIIKTELDIYLGYFSDKCNFHTVYIKGNITKILKNKPVKSIQVNDQPIQYLDDYKIIIRPLEWVFGEFVGSSARNNKKRIKL